MVLTMLYGLQVMPSKINIRIVGLTILLLTCFSLSNFGQVRIDKSSYIGRGHCIDIFNEIKDSTKSDSLSVSEFIKYYKFENGISFRPNQWKDFIIYVKAKENKCIFCRLRESDREVDLIDVPRNKNSGN